MRKTKIICTLGPACDDENLLKQMIQNGLDCARLNFSHGTHAEQKVRMDRVKKVRQELGIPLPILLDTKGPEIRVRLFENKKVEGEKATGGGVFVSTKIKDAMASRKEVEFGDDEQGQSDKALYYKLRQEEIQKFVFIILNVTKIS